MRVLSLYDGMSCGMLAFMRAGIPVESYDAYEIDKHAVKVSQHNFPQIVQHGDVFKGDFASYRGKVDAVVGGSPCFVAGTMVLTSDGMKPIEQVRVGDLVLTHRHRFRPVTAVGHKTAPVFRLSSDGIPDIIVTENHPFYVSRMTVGRYGARSYSEPCWKAVGELVPDRDFLSSPIMAGSLNPRGLTVDHCRLLAMMLTDRHTPDRYGLWADDVASENHVSLDRTAPLTQLVSENSVPYHPDFREIPVEVLQLPQDLAHAFLGCFLDLVAKHDAENDVWTYRAKNRAMAYSLALLAQKVYGTPGLVAEETLYRGCDDGSVAPTNVWAVTVGYGTSRMVSGRRIGNDLFTRFASLEPCGEAKVYNLSVEQDESYLADDRIVHNCTYWSIAQSKNRETEAHGIGWELFQQYVRAVREAEPRFFVYENNKSMAKAIREEISATFGFEPICINSALVSAQNRQRLYWVGVRNDDGTYHKASIDQPEDRGILLKDVLDGNFRNPLSENEVEYMVRPTADGRNHFDFGHNADSSKGKSPCITASLSKGVPYNVLVDQVAEPVAVASRTRNFPDGSTAKRLEANGPKANCLTTVQTDCMVAEPVRVGSLPRPNGELSQSQAMRIYDTDGKSVGLKACGGGLGAKAGLYAIPTGINEPVRVGIMPRSDGEVFDRQGTRIYDPDGKSITLSGDGGGAKEKTGLYAIPVEDPKGFSMTGTFGERHASVNDKAYCLAANPSSDMSAREIEPVREEIPLNSSDGKSRTLMAGYGKFGMQTLIAQKGWNGGTTAVAEPIPVNTTVGGKAQCVRASCYKDSLRNLVGNDVEQRTCVAYDVTEPVPECEALSEEYYKGGFDGELVGMVETEAPYRNGEQPSQQYRVYHCDSKSKCLDQDQRRFYLTPDEVGKGQPVYTVEGGRITINGKSYPIKLKDGRYIIRKLSVDECKRLQTVPDWYDMSCISKSQAYKCLGNGWTIDIIAHLIEGAVRELDPDFVPKEVKAGPVAKVATLDSFTEVSP